ncbi:YbbR-like domain-containing protein [Prevotella corporis]|uniref:YbbR-like domain-containing protein n=1 Tax=Prevotella corporis TaxID=28128 RepID=UPI0023F92D08|nr:YbbR-like domain-containing protein [Prevotella corporis]
MVGRPLHTFSIIRNLLSKLFNKEFLVFLFFLILSGLFWLTNALDDPYEKEIEVDLRLAGIPKNVVLTSEVDSVIRVTVRDKGYVIGLYLFRKQLHPLFFDFSTFSGQNNTGEIPVSEIQKQLSQQLYTSTKILSVKADNLSFSFNYGQRKKIPVSMLGVAAPGEGYFLSRVQFAPDSVTVYAAKKLLDSIQTAYTVRQEVVNFTEPQEITVQLRKIRNAKLMPNKVKMKLFPDVLTEETVEVPVEAINVPPNKVMRIFPRKIKVNFAIGAQRVKSMPKNIETKQLLPTGFKVVVDYNEVADHASEKCHVYIQATPNGVRNARPAVNVVDYLIEQR